jgi:hypothetical protein
MVHTIIKWIAVIFVGVAFHFMKNIGRADLLVGQPVF